MYIRLIYIYIGIYICIYIYMILYIHIQPAGCGIARVGASTCWKKWRPFQCFVAFWSGKKCSQKRSFFLDFATLTAQISDLFCLATFIDHCACRPPRFFLIRSGHKAFSQRHCQDRMYWSILVLKPSPVFVQTSPPMERISTHVSNMCEVKHGSMDLSFTD